MRFRILEQDAMYYVTQRMNQPCRSTAATALPEPPHPQDSAAAAPSTALLTLSPVQQDSDDEAHFEPDVPEATPEQLEAPTEPPQQGAAPQTCGLVDLNTYARVIHAL